MRIFVRRHPGVGSHTRYWQFLATILIFVLPTTGCTNDSAVRGAIQVDSAELAAREARRREFLAEQQAQTDSALRARPFRSGLVVDRPTLVVFFPPTAQATDSVALMERVKMYREVAESLGWSFEQRYSERLRITDQRSNALYAVPLPTDSTGVVLVAPGARPQVWFGNLSRSTLREGLLVFLDALRGMGAARQRASERCVV